MTDISNEIEEIRKRQNSDDDFYENTGLLPPSPQLMKDRKALLAKVDELEGFRNNVNELLKSGDDLRGWHCMDCHDSQEESLVDQIRDLMTKKSP